MSKNQPLAQRLHLASVLSEDFLDVGPPLLQVIMLRSVPGPSRLPPTQAEAYAGGHGECCFLKLPLLCCRLVCG